MTLDEILENDLPRWAQITKEDPVLFSRIALFRNVKGIHFPSRLTGEERKKSSRLADEAVQSLNDHGYGPFIPYSLKALDRKEKEILAEKGFLPEEEQPLDDDTRLYVNEDGSLAVRTNVKDHLAYLGFSGGNTVYSLWKRASRLADESAGILDYAFDREFGYLTASPQYTGTGLKMVSLLFLPGFTVYGRIGELAEFLELRGFHLTPVTGKADSRYPYYRIENTRSLGIREMDYVSEMDKILQEISEEEKKLWKETFESSEDVLRDRIWRAVGTLKYARRIGKEEALYLAGLIRMGINADMIPDEDGLLFYRLYSLIPDSQVAEITHSTGVGEKDMEMWRSALLRDALKGL